MKLRSITVEGVAYEVDVEVLEGTPSAPGTGTITSPPPIAIPSRPAAPVTLAPPATAPASPVSAAGGNVCKAPIAGTVVQVKVKLGDNVAINQVLVVMEAMKMETNIASPIAGKVKGVPVKPGQAVKAGQVLVEFE